MTIIDKLKDIKTQDANIKSISSQEARIFKDLLKSLPRHFPCPDKYIIRELDCDICFYYKQIEKEKPESLKMLLEMVFGANDWHGIIDKDEEFALTTVIELQNTILRLLIKADINDYDYYFLEDKVIYKKVIVNAKKFTPFDIKHDIITPEIFKTLQFESDVTSMVSEWWLKILDTLISKINKKTPIPKSIQGIFNKNYDVEFEYEEDKRQQIENLYGPCLWRYRINKQTGDGFAYSLININSIKIKIIIKPEMEDLKLIKETFEYLEYEAY